MEAESTVTREFYGTIKSMGQRGSKMNLDVSITKPDTWQSNYEYAFYIENDDPLLQNPLVKLNAEMWFEADQGRKKKDSYSGQKPFHFYWDNLRVAEPPEEPEPLPTDDAKRDYVQPGTQPAAISTNESIARQVALKGSIEFLTRRYESQRLLKVPLNGGVPLPDEERVIKTAELFLPFLLGKKLT